MPNFNWWINLPWTDCVFTVRWVCVVCEACVCALQLITTILSIVEHCAKGTYLSVALFDQRLFVEQIFFPLTNRVERRDQEPKMHSLSLSLSRQKLHYSVGIFACSSSPSLSHSNFSVTLMCAGIGGHRKFCDSSYIAWYISATISEMQKKQDGNKWGKKILPKRRQFRNKREMPREHWRNMWTKDLFRSFASSPSPSSSSPNWYIPIPSYICLSFYIRQRNERMHVYVTENTVGVVSRAHNSALI